MKKINWNEGWKFWKDNNSFALVWNVPEDAGEVTLPHDAMIEDPIAESSPNGTSTGFRNGGTYIYVKQFDAPADWKGKKILVRFDGIYMNAMVYLNEQLVAQNPYGYTGFYAELGNYLNYGGANELRVIVRSGAMPNSRWYSGSGIYRDVYLLVAERTYLVPEGLEIRTEDVEDYPGYHKGAESKTALAILGASVEIANEGTEGKQLTALTTILDQDGKIAGTETTPLYLCAGEKRTIRQRIAVTDPVLWSDETPYLYAARTQLISDGKIVDEEESTIGIRTLTVDAVRGLRVNGVGTLLRGACIHHDSGILGAATYRDAAYRQIRKLKEAGFNAIRMSHHPAAPVLLDACDALGMYVMDELTDMWTRPKSDYDYGLSFTKWWQQDVTAMVRKDYNRPSVILYSIGNEIPEIGTKLGSKVAHEISELIHKLDGTRFTTAGINGVFAAGDRVPEIMADIMKSSPAAEAGDGDKPEVEEGGNVNDFMTVMDTRMDDIVTHPAVSERLAMAAEALDVSGYNYMTARYAKDQIAYPNRVIVGSETYPPEIARNWEEILNHSNVIGDFTWTGWDYIGEAGIGIPAYPPERGGFAAGFPSQLAYIGDIDITGFRRPASYYREIVFGRRKAPYVVVQDPKHYGEQLIKTTWVISDALHSWTYPGYEGKPAVVEVYGIYSAADASDGQGKRTAEVELLLNGKSIGRQPVQAPGAGVIGDRAVFEVTYEPGTLEAVLYDADGKEVGRDLLTTTAAAEQIAAEVEPEEKKGGSLVYINLLLQDGAGKVMDSYAYDEELKIASSENLEILGFGSANPKPDHNYNEGVTDTWNGRAQLIVRRIDADKGACVEIVSAGGKRVRAEI